MLLQNVWAQCAAVAQASWKAAERSDWDVKSMLRAIEFTKEQLAETPFLNPKESALLTKNVAVFYDRLKVCSCKLVDSRTWITGYTRGIHMHTDKDRHALLQTRAQIHTFVYAATQPSVHIHTCTCTLSVHISTLLLSHRYALLTVHIHAFICTCFDMLTV